MNTSEFDFVLPPELIAQTSVVPRDASNLMVVNHAAQSIEHAHFFDIETFLKPGDLLVRNVSKVFRSRLYGKLSRKFGSPAIEIFLLRPLEQGTWHALVRPGKKAPKGTTIYFENEATGTIVVVRADGSVEIDFHIATNEVFALCDVIGHVPVPPYVHQEPETLEQYQTVYARDVGSVAAPTAGFHFTEELIAKLRDRGVRFADVVLHVGIGTFRPMKTETIEEHTMHEEFVALSGDTAHAIAETKRNGGRVIAVGTTTVRTLEGIAAKFGALKPYDGMINIFITPGFEFKVIDGLITNFHLPKSTLLVLVSAFAGKKLIDRAYAEAIEHRYRFFSFGDAMLIVASS